MPIQTIAIIGAGVEGRAIALIVLRGGCRAVLEDFSLGTLEHAEAYIGESLGNSPEQVVKSPTQLPDGGSARLGFDLERNFSVCTGVEDAIREADLIIETAADELETKLELFTIFDKFAKPGAIFATTSVAHPIGEIADVTCRAERCVTLRFLPAANPGRVSIVAGTETSRQTMERCTEFAQRLGIKVELPLDSSKSLKNRSLRD